MLIAYSEKRGEREENDSKTARQNLSYYNELIHKYISLRLREERVMRKRESASDAKSLINSAREHIATAVHRRVARTLKIWRLFAKNGGDLFSHTTGSLP